MMSRLTKINEIHNNEPISYNVNISNYPSMMGYEYQQAEMDAINKLGQLEDIEDELGCPLDVVFKALEEGIVIIGDLKENGDITLWLDKKPLIALIGEKRNFEEPRLIKYNVWCFSCESGSYSGCVALEDYGKTWWLKGDRSDTNE